MNLASSVSGHFDICVRSAETNAIVRQLSFDNQITDIGLRTYCGSDEIRYGAGGATAAIVLGSGTNAPRVTDTTLGSIRARSNDASFSNQAAGTPPEYISSCKLTVRFPPPTTSASYTEIGVAGNEDLLWCRALILDELGQPTALVVLPNEYLDVTYTLYYHPNLSDTNFQFTLEGVTYNCVARAGNVGMLAFRYNFPLCFYWREFGIVDAYGSQTLGDVTTRPSSAEGGVYVDAIGTRLHWDSADPYTVKSVASIGLDKANFEGGIGSMVLGVNSENGYGITSYTQVSFSPKLPKDVNTTMTFTLKQSISRWVP